MNDKTDLIPSLTAGDRIKKERRMRGMTQMELGNTLGISVSYLGAIERGERGISSSVMNRLHEQLNLSYDYLLDGMNSGDSCIPQYVKEESHYGIRHNIDSMLSSCSEQELESCYDIMYTYLVHYRRTKKQRKEQHRFQKEE